MNNFVCSLQHWSKLNKSGGEAWPQKRCGHAACCLNYGQRHPQLFMTGGVGRGDKVLHDAWIFDVNTGRWRKVRLIILCYNCQYNQVWDSSSYTRSPLGQTILSLIVRCSQKGVMYVLYLCNKIPYILCIISHCFNKVKSKYFLP